MSDNAEHRRVIGLKLQLKRINRQLKSKRWEIHQLQARGMEITAELFEIEKERDRK